MTHMATSSTRPVVYEAKAVTYVALENEIHGYTEPRIRDVQHIPEGAVFTRTTPKPNPNHQAIYTWRWWVVESASELHPMTDRAAERWNDPRREKPPMPTPTPAPEPTVGPTRAEHLAWCKQRALEYVDAGDNAQAFASMISDLRKHPDTRNHAAIELGAMQLMAGMLNTPREMRDYIEGCN
jgi:hypothetical protein